ncbi:hypothetical protein L2E82_16070 [Cichorium intybus]|uniref:Uncharacterized protein n=1 Tax=Cichorium intybus TaxID=13427 RepID=A0ACB9F4I4_CICIN|nr:hypothetical protein L2E82_16070 [Cichorium intybus]
MTIILSSSSYTGNIDECNGCDFIAMGYTSGSELTHILPLTSSSCVLDEDIEVLKKQKHKVFVIHTSLELGVRLFQAAKKMGMTGDGYIWIATNRITNLFHSIDSRIIYSLKGMIGVKSYFPKNTRDLRDFRKRFHQKFRSDYPDEEHDEPGIFGSSFLGLGYSLVFSEALLAPAIPSVSARAGGIFLPLVKALCVACGRNVGDETEHKIGSWLMLTCFQTSVISSSMFLTAMTANPLSANLTFNTTKAEGCARHP